MRCKNYIKKVDYQDGFQYAGSILQFFPHPEGYVKVVPAAGTPNGPPLSYAYNHVFNYTDHLGNVRITYTKDPKSGYLEIMDENHYFPFGLKHTVYVPVIIKDLIYIIEEPGEGEVKLKVVTKTDYLYEYNGKEWQDELGLNMNDYGARNYDPALGRWMNMDPLAESFLHSSLYVYALNNPMYYIDPDGMSSEGFYTKFVNERTKEVIDIDDGINQTLTVSNSIFNSAKRYRNTSDPMNNSGYQSVLFDAISYSLSKNGTTSFFNTLLDKYGQSFFIKMISQLEPDTSAYGRLVNLAVDNSDAVLFALKLVAWRDSKLREYGASNALQHQVATMLMNLEYGSILGVSIANANEIQNFNRDIESGQWVFALLNFGTQTYQKRWKNITTAFEWDDLKNNTIGTIKADIYKTKKLIKTVVNIKAGTKIFNIKW